MQALVIGGTGPTGPYIVNGLRDRGYEVAILHRGTHDTDAVPATVERIVGDPHFRETLAEVLADRTFDLVVATYGRIRFVAEVLVGKTPRLITIGGAPLYKGMLAPGTLYPAGLQVPLGEDAPKVESEAAFRFGYLVRITEEAVMQHHAAGHYVATHLRYPVVYGPRQIQPTTWHVMRRVLDGRRHIVMPDGGLTLITRGYAENMAHAVLLAVDQPDTAGGQVYNCGDEQQFSMAQWIEVVAQATGGKLEVIGVPDAYAYPARELMVFNGPSHHQYFDLFKIRSELGYRDRVPALEAIERTVAWYLQHRPDKTAEFKSSLDKSYAVEDQLVAIYRDACRKMAAVKHEEKTFHHAYPHPKQPGLRRDHRAR